MTDYIKNKLSNFIDDLISHRLDELEFDIWSEKKKQSNYYYTIDLDTKIPTNPQSTFGVSFSTQKIHLSVNTNGLILFMRDEFNEYKDEDLEFTKKYSNIIKNLYTQRQKEIVDKIIDSSYTDLKLQRESNIRKLIG